MILHGIPITFSPLCLRESNEPTRPYRRRRWQSDAQYVRRAKKWLKRFGTTKVPCIFQTPTGFIAHPSFRAMLEIAVR